MADKNTSPTQQAAEAVVKNLNVAAPATTVSAEQVRRAAENPTTTPSNKALILPDALKQGGKK
jgi:hypothetical protein